MDRRTLIVGGGAAALAATLSAVTGNAAPAAASTTDAPATTTADHACLVLSQVNADLGLVNPDGLQQQFQAYTANQQGFAQPDADSPPTNDMDGWIRQSMVNLCGTDSHEAAVASIPQTRTLLAFSYLVYSQNQGIALPPADPGTPVPPVLASLEPDFLPVLLGQINDRSETTPAFGDAMQASSAMLDQMVAANGPTSPGDGGPDVPRVYTGVGIAFQVIFVGVFVLIDRMARKLQ